MLEHLVRKLGSLSALSEGDRQTVRTLFSGGRRIASGEDISREGKAPASVSVIIEGLACRYKSLPDGRRQILAFQAPGDLLDLHGFLMGDMDYSVVALTPCRIVSAPYQKLSEALDQSPVLHRALWKTVTADGAMAREWLVGLGRRSAYGRIAHLLCEVTQRLQLVGAEDASELPLTQQELADSLGLSLVHVNRVLQRLRASGLISLGRGSLQVLDWDGLKQAGGFDPAYLYAGGVMIPAE